jgi:hypothetical protein
MSLSSARSLVGSESSLVCESAVRYPPLVRGAAATRHGRSAPESALCRRGCVRKQHSPQVIGQLNKPSSLTKTFTGCTL